MTENLQPGPGPGAPRAPGPARLVGGAGRLVLGSPAGKLQRPAPLLLSSPLSSSSLCARLALAMYETCMAGDTAGPGRESPAVRARPAGDEAMPG